MHPATMHYHEPSDSYGCRPKTLRLRAELIRRRQPWSILVWLIWSFLFGLNLQQQNRAKTCKKTWPLCTNQSSQQKTNLVNLTKTTIVTSRSSWASGATEFRGKLAWKLMHLRFLATFGMAAKNMFDYNRTWAGPFEEFLVRQHQLIVETWSHSNWGMVDSWFSAYIGPNTNLKESGW